MHTRTTIEIDRELLERAKRALGESTMRATVEHALRRVAEDGAAIESHRTERQRRYLEELRSHADLGVLGSDAMWR